MYKGPIRKEYYKIEYYENLGEGSNGVHVCWKITERTNMRESEVVANAYTAEELQEMGNKYLLGGN